MNREPAKSFRDLVVWQRSHALTHLQTKIDPADLDDVARLLGGYIRALLAPSTEHRAPNS